MPSVVKDTLYRRPHARVTGFDFGEQTAHVFDDMLGRSVPLYEEIQRMVVELAGVFVQAGSRVYDLGCSTGTTLLQLARRFPDNDVQFIGVDNSAPMLAQARQKLAKAGQAARCDLQLADFNDVEIDQASVVIMILTLQFVRPLHRDMLIRRIYQGLKPNGCLLLVEKVLCHDSEMNRIFINQYYDFKRRQGYSDLEIAQKREALENILVPYRVDEDLMLLSRNRFSATDVFFRWYNFAGMIAIKRRR